jgi:type I restriction enzyme M protein
MARAKKADATTSPQAKLAAVIKTARDAMRKDAGLNGDLDRIPQLAWLLFLKAFDGLEENREITDGKYRPAIDAPYRWRDWAADPNGMTGDTLVDFVNAQLLPYLRGLSGTGAHDPRDVLAAVFKETNNRMLSGYLLRDVVNKVNEINFASSDDIHTMAHLYESMLKDMRDAAGDSGEFYTPRPVIRFMVQQVAPQLGEVILDPACGTGGFLVEALTEMEPKVETTQQHRKLHENLRGIEKKPLPYLLGMMNLVLHGVGQPNVTRGNALNRPITQISRAERVDVVLTNPPFGGEEEKSIQANFPADKQTDETAWLFLQLVIRQLKDGGRCGIVVPNGILFGDGVGARIKQQLLTECNLHTVVRLPDGVFEPYTPIPSNLLFFEKTGRTKEVWFYEIPPPEGRKKYSKTKPMRFEEFADCQTWWNARAETEQAWRVPIADIEANGWNLDLRNPHGPEDLSHRPPRELLDELVKVEREIVTLVEQLQDELAGEA